MQLKYRLQLISNSFNNFFSHWSCNIYKLLHFSVFIATDTNLWKAIKIELRIEHIENSFKISHFTFQAAWVLRKWGLVTIVNSNLIRMNNFVGFCRFLRVKYLFIFSLSGWNKFLMEAQYKVLCVCLGNICRSPTAEVVLDIIVISINSISLSIQLEQVTIIQIKHLISVANCMQKKEAMTYLLCGQDNFQLKTF